MSPNDNRNYDYTYSDFKERTEYNLIAELVHNNSNIVDLGCGNGSLITKLIKENNCIAKGVEISSSGVEVCKRNKLDVLHGRIDEALPFADNEFDYAICNVTIQMVMYPEVLLSEMKRISKYQIISFPNFGFYKNNQYKLWYQTQIRVCNSCRQNHLIDCSALGRGSANITKSSITV